MKKLNHGFLLLVIVAALLSFIPDRLIASEALVTNTEQKQAESAKAQNLLTRLHEIDAMDKSVMSSPEKRKLRKEVRSIKNTLNEMGEGVYLSVGAIIIIILLLILLL